MNQQWITASSDGARLAYWRHDCGRPGAGTLLLLHGAASNHTRWSEFLDTTSLTRHWHVLAPDLRGNGRSMTRGRQDIPVWCADLHDVLQAERVDHALLMGHSLGAQIAVHFAHRFPAAVEGLVLIDPVFQTALKGRQRMVRRYRWAFRLLLLVIRALNRMGIHRRHVEDRDLRELDAETRRALAGAPDFEAVARRYGALGPILQHTPSANYLRQALATVTPLPRPESVMIPVLVLLSGGTTLASPDTNRREAARFPGGEIVVVQANHWPLTEAPDVVRDAVETWVRSNFDTTGWRG